MTVDTESPTYQETIHEYTSLNAEAKRLLEFKNKHMKKRDQASCPQCATLVNIRANKCPHCGSDIADYTAEIREELGKLTKITEELHELHDRYMECHEQESAMRPFLERIKGFFSDQKFREDLKIILPSFLLFFVLISALRVSGTGLLFWSVAIPSAAIGYFLLRKSSYRKHVTVDLYRVVLVIGLLLVGSGFVTSTLSGWPNFSSNSVKVQSSVANIRESNNTNSKIVATANRGDKLKVEDRQGAWYKVQTSDGQTGWVYASLVED